MGADDFSTGYWATGFASEAYKIEPNMTRTFQFVNKSSKANVFNGYYTLISSSNNVWNYNDHYIRLRPDFYGWTESSGNTNDSPAWLISNTNGSGIIFGNTENENSFKNNLDGATVNLTIKRLEEKVFIIADVQGVNTTVENDINPNYRHYFVMTCGDGTQDIYAFLCVDGSQTIIDNEKSTYETSEAYPTISGKKVGLDDNTTAFWSAFSDYYTIAPNQSMKLKFKNYTNKVNNFNNFVAYVTTDADRGATGYTEYLGLRSDNWVNVANVFCTSQNFGDGFSWDWNAYKDKMDGATIDLTITRTDAKVTVRADITPSDAGTSFYEEYYQDCGDGTQNIRLFLVAEGSHLDILPESIEIGATGWGTYVSDYNLDFSKAEDGLTAYKVTEKDGSSIKTEELTGVVNAGTPMLLKAETASTSYAVPVATAAGAAITGNCLKAGDGTAVNKETGKDRYVMVNKGGTAVFRKLGETGPVVATNRAYIEFVADGDAHELLSLDGNDATAIKNIKVGSEDNVYYNLNGQRVLYPTKGLYIVNGKKVIIK